MPSTYQLTSGFAWRRGVFLCLFCVILIVDVAAQSEAQGTIYSRYGLGERLGMSSSRSQGMAGGGLAFRSINGTNYGNPATLSDLIFARFTAGFVRNNTVESAEGFEDSKLASGYLNAVQLSFPLRSRKVGFGISSSPYTRIAYRVDEGGTFESEPGAGDTIPYGVTFNGNGGLQKVSAGLGFAPSTSFSIGASADLLFGLLENVQTTNFISPAFDDGVVAETTRLSGLTGTFGIWYRQTGFLTTAKGFSAGAIVTLPASLKGERVVSSGRSGAADTLATIDVNDVQLPLSGTVSVAYQQSVRMKFALDLLYEGWGSVTSDVSFPGQDGDGEYIDRYRFSAGFEYGGGPSSDAYIRRVLFRFGLYLDNSYVTPQVGTKIKTMGFTTGVSMPTLVLGTTLDINIDVGQTGTTDNGLIRDRYFKFAVNLNFAERWFNNPKLR